MYTDLIEFYNGLISKYQSEHDKLKTKSRLIAIGRGLLFILLIGILSFTWKYGAWYIFVVSVISISPFLVLVKYNVSIHLKVKHLKELILVNQNELSALQGDHSVFDSGSEFVDPSHPNSFDLDIFGEGSIYQLLNRSCTMGGSVCLSESLKNQGKGPSEIIERQQAIKEMAGLPEWRQNFQVTGKIALDTSSGGNSNSGWFQSNINKNAAESRFHGEMMEWLSGHYQFLSKKILKFLLMVLPAISLVLFVLMVAGTFPVMGFILFGFLQLSITGGYLKWINRLHGQIGRKAQILNKYGSLLTLIEKQNFQSDFLQRLKNISGVSDKTASKKLKQLQSLVSALDNRLNILFSIVANAYLLWDLQVVYRIENWRKDNALLMSSWFDAIYQIDSLSGFAAFSFNNPAYCFPKIEQGDFLLEMEQAGHPLIMSINRVNNNLKIDVNGQLLVITGANMAGKSTFLRTVGVNMILAMAGSSVCAEKFKMGPIQLHTSIRTSDSVQKSESYFFAELKRLKVIIDRMQNGEKLFVIIDEMLRGTNSRDKHLGSQALIEQLIRLNGSGLLATHDIALGELAEKYPKNVTNYRFEVEILNNELVFDYKLKNGISQNLNATFLMKKMGITL